MKRRAFLRSIAGAAVVPAVAPAVVTAGVDVQAAGAVSCANTLWMTTHGITSYAAAREMLKFQKAEMDRLALEYMYQLTASSLGITPEQARQNFERSNYFVDPLKPATDRG